MQSSSCQDLYINTNQLPLQNFVCPYAQDRFSQQSRVSEKYFGNKIFCPVSVLPLRKFYTAQILVLCSHAIAQPCRHTTSKSFQALEGLWNVQYICDITFRIFKVRENEISLHKWFHGCCAVAHLRGKIIRYHIFSAPNTW